VVTAETDARGLCTGYTFTLEDHPRDDQNRKYLITSTSYNIDAGEIFSAGAAGAESAYSCSFTAIDAATPFRSSRITPKPSIPGPQTAIVVGPSGEEIFADEFGRVKVQFHWDRRSNSDENSSCWIRVAQVWAGKDWGALYNPRIGQEVIVEFLEGDPDHPIITGRVYNGQAMPPYDPKSEPTKSTIKSSSSKGGEGFNEIRFEDKTGEEQVFIHGEKDLHIRVKNDRRETIVHDRHLVVENDKFEHVKNERNEKVDKSHFEEIGEDRNLTVKGKEDKEVKKDLKLTVKGKADEEITKNYTLTAKEVTIEGKSKIELKVGGSTIKMDSGQIEIKSSMVKIN
jgi:type VI secretion system secreted protein VgrG